MGKKNASVKPGDILRIPVDDFFVAAKIIWISQRYKDVTGIVVYPACFQEAGRVRPTDGDYVAMDMGGDEVRVLYPSIANVTKKRIWDVIGASELTQRDEALCHHIIGPGLCQGDVEIRTATADDYARYQRMMTAGLVVVQNLIRQARSKLPQAD